MTALKKVKSKSLTDKENKLGLNFALIKYQIKDYNKKLELLKESQPQTMQWYKPRAQMKKERRDAKKAKAQHRRQNMPKKMGKRVEHIYTQVDKIQSATHSMQNEMHRIEMQKNRI